MTFALLALICLVAFAGPLFNLSPRLRLPVVIGELAVGVVLGQTGLQVVDGSDPTLTFLADIGFALVMFVAGTHVPLRNPEMRSGLVPGILRAVGVGILAIPVGFGLAALFGTGHGAHVRGGPRVVLGEPGDAGAGRFGERSRRRTDARPTGGGGRVLHHRAAPRPAAGTGRCRGSRFAGCDRGRGGGVPAAALVGDERAAAPRARGE